MHDPSTSRSNFCLWWTMEMTSSQSCLESYKNWDFRVGKSYHNYLIIPVTREILDTQESSQLSTRARFPAIPGQNPLRAQRLWKSHISAAAEDCAEEGPHCGDPGYAEFGWMVAETAAFQQLLLPCTWPDERPGCAQEHPWMEHREFPSSWAVQC